MNNNKIIEALKNKKTPSLLVHVGTTYSISSPEKEVAKALLAQEYGADIISDASVGNQSKQTIKELCNNLNIPVTCLPGYIIATEKNNCTLNTDLTYSEILETTEELLQFGVSGITIHPAFLSNHIESLDKSKRVFPFTSRMGGYTYDYMKQTKKENPFYVCFDDIIKLVKKYNAVLSIGLATRSPSIVNDGGFDALYKSEIDVASELIRKCNENNVTTTLEAGGHFRLEKLFELDTYIKSKCYNVPLRVLSVLTDRGMGHDNVTGAITAAFLCKTNAKIICVVTRAEHIGHPTIEDIIEGIINFKIALSCVYPDEELEYKVARSRATGGCHLKGVIDNVIDPKGAFEYCVKHISHGEDTKEIDLSTCTMCGDSCPLRKINID